MLRAGPERAWVGPSRWAPALTAAALLGAVPIAAAATVTGAGSTFASPAYGKWCRESGLCAYAAIGSTGGLNAAADRDVDFAGSDALPTADQLARISDAAGGVGPLYFPTLLGAVTIPTNVTGLTGRLRLRGDVLGRIFDGEVTSWNDHAIASTNPGVRLPAAPITVCVRADGSGTSFAFSRYLTKVSPSFKAKVNFSQTPRWTAPRILTGTGNPGVAQCVKNTPNSLGYVDVPDAVEAGLAPEIAAIGRDRIRTTRTRVGGRVRVRRTRVTTYVLPGARSISAAAESRRIPPSLLVDVSDSPTPGAYPIAITTWVVAYGNYTAAGKDLSGVKRVLGYFYSPAAQRELVNLGYAPLPAGLRAAAVAQIAKLR